MSDEQRNRHVLTIDVEFDEPVNNPEEAAKRLASDLFAELREDEPWGWGRARIVGVYPNPEIMARPAFVPEGQ